MRCRTGCGREATHYVDFPETGVYWYCEQHSHDAVAAITVRAKGEPSSFNLVAEAASQQLGGE